MSNDMATAQIRCVCGNGQYDTKSGTGQNYSTIGDEEIWKLIQNPPSVPKEQAQWFIPSSYHAADARAHNVQRDQGCFHWLAADIDEGNPSLADVVQAVKATLPETRFLVYSSRSATPERRKWRVLVPVASALSGWAYVAAQSAWFDMLEGHGLHLDRSLERAAQPIYLPNRGAYYEWHYEPGSPLRRDAALWTAARAKGQELAESVASRPKDEGPNSPIAAFRRKHSVAEMLEAYGYLQKGRGDHWRSPYQQSGGYATADYGDYWISLSGSDAERGVGAPTRSGHRFGDAFDLYVHYGCGGDHEKALAYAKSCLKEERAWLEEHGRRIWAGVTSVGGRRIKTSFSRTSSGNVSANPATKFQAMAA